MMVAQSMTDARWPISAQSLTNAQLLTDVQSMMVAQLSMTVVHHVRRKVTLASLRVRNSVEMSTACEILVHLRTIRV